MSRPRKMRHYSVLFRRDADTPAIGDEPVRVIYDTVATPGIAWRWAQEQVDDGIYREVLSVAEVEFDNELGEWRRL